MRQHTVQNGNNYPTRCNRVQFILICQLPNMFRVVFHQSSGAHNTVSTVCALMRPVLLPVVNVAGRERPATFTTGDRYK